MRAPVYLVCAATLMSVLASSAEHTNDAASSNNYYGDGGRMLEPLNVAADTETINELLPRLTAKYRPNNDWAEVSDPRFYVLTEMESNEFDHQGRHLRSIDEKRSENQPSLSIKAPIQALFNAIQKEKLRRRQKENQDFLRQLTDIYA